MRRMSEQEYEEWHGMLVPVIEIGTPVRFMDHRDIIGVVANRLMLDSGACLYDVEAVLHGRGQKFGSLTRDEIEPLPLDTLDRIEKFLEED